MTKVPIDEELLRAIRNQTPWTKGDWRLSHYSGETYVDFHSNSIAVFRAKYLYYTELFEAKARSEALLATFLVDTELSLWQQANKKYVIKNKKEEIRSIRNQAGTEIKLVKEITLEVIEEYIIIPKNYQRKEVSE